MRRETCLTFSRSSWPFVKMAASKSAYSAKGAFLTLTISSTQGAQKGLAFLSFFPGGGHCPPFKAERLGASGPKCTVGGRGGGECLPSYGPLRQASLPTAIHGDGRRRAAAAAAAAAAAHPGDRRRHSITVAYELQNACMAARGKGTGPPKRKFFHNFTVSTSVTPYTIS